MLRAWSDDVSATRGGRDGQGVLRAWSNEGMAGNQVGQEQLTPRRELRGPGAEAARGQGRAEQSRAEVCVGAWVRGCVRCNAATRALAGKPNWYTGS
jgi:hypothetical protein